MKKIDFLFDKIIFFCILLFPLLDIVTSIMTYNNFNFTIGLVIKAFLLVIIYLYCFFSKNISKFNKVFTIIFSVFCLGNLANNFTYIYPNFNMDYFTLVVKYAYFVILIIFFSDYLKKKNYKTSILKAPLKIILLSMLIALITSTSMPSYENIYKFGVGGWFFSANEIGSLLTLLYPISIYLFFHDDNSRKIEWIYVMIHGMSLLLLGTKVGLIGFFGVSIAYIFYRLIFIKKYSYKNGLLLMVFMVFVSLALWDNLPCVKNTNDKYANITNYYENVDLTEEEKEEAEQIVVDELVYSGRNNYLEKLKQTKNNVDKDVDSSKLKNNKNYKKIANDYLGFMYTENGYLLLIERDHYDILFFFGRLGLFFAILTILNPLLRNIKNLFKNLFNINVSMLLFSLVLSIGIACISGHTFMSPMVSFYISIIIGLIVSEVNQIKNIEKKKILISSVHMDFGGIEKTLVNLLKNIDYKKYEIDLFLLLRDGALLYDIPKDVSILYPYNKLFTRIICAKNIVSKVIKHVLYNKFTASLWVNNKHYDVAIDYAGYYDFITSYVKYSFANKKCIWVHSQPKFILSDSKLKKYNDFDKIVLVSNSALLEMKQILPDKIAKLDVMWNIIDYPSIENENIIWPNDCLKILAVGRLCDAKRYDKLIDIAEMLKKKNEDFVIYILGDGPLKEALQTRINEKHLQETVKLLGSKNNIGDYMKSADIFAMVSDYEGLPTVILESLVCGLPYIGFRIPALEEISTEIAPKNSYVLADNNYEDFVNAVIAFKKNKKFKFDLETYNKCNINKFEEIIG